MPGTKYLLDHLDFHKVKKAAKSSIYTALPYLESMLHLRRSSFIIALVVFCCLPAFILSSQDVIGKIPFRLIDDIIYIEVGINDQQGFNFMFDTGSSTTVIGKSTADRLNLERGTDGKSMGAAGAYDTEVFFNNRIQIEHIELKNITLIQTADNLESTVFGEELHGIIGYDIFSKYVVEINYDNNLISLFDFKAFKYNGSGQKFDFKSFSNIPYLPFSVVLNGKTYEGNYLIDTGAQLEILLTSPFVEQKEILIELQKQYRLSKNIGIDDNTIELIISRLDKAKVFGYEFNNVPMVTSKINQAVFALDAFHGIIGNGILKRFKTTYDYSQNKLYVEDGQALNLPFGADSFGASFERNFEDRILIIESIIPDSPAEKSGIRPGDEILMMNGIRTHSLSNDQLRSFTEADGEKLKLLIRRGARKLNLTIRLKSLI